MRLKLLVFLTLWTLLAVALPSRTVNAQTVPAFNVQTWRPGVAPDDALMAKSALVLGHLDWAAYVGLGYARTPFRLQNSAIGASQTLVGDLGTLELGAALGLWDRAQVALSLPLAGVIRGGGQDLAQIPQPKAPAMGDVRVDLRVHLLETPLADGKLHLGLAGVADLPTAARGSMLGGSLSGTLEALATLLWDQWRADVNVGARAATTQALQVHDVDSLGFTIQNSALTTIVRSGPVWLVRGALRRGFLDDLLGARAELHAQGSLLGTPIPKNQAVVDLLLGGDLRVADAWRIFAALGGAPTTAMGSAGFRVLGGVQFDARKVNRDQDQDGILDKDDKCPDEPEDRDGFEDSDGCPDADDDADGIPDVADKCPRAAEDKDGFEDTDGCPDPDNDHDGVPDAADKCPNVAEDVDGFDDADGCPDPDNDKDGIPDVDDLCPSAPETVNGFEDGDGCPDVVPPPPQVETPKVEAPPPAPVKVEKPLTKKEKAALAKKLKAEKKRAAQHALAEKRAQLKQAKAEKAAAKKQAKLEKKQKLHEKKPKPHRHAKKHKAHK